MTDKEVISNLYRLIGYVQLSEEKPPFFTDMVTALLKSIKELEKSVPKKPIYQHYEEKDEKPYIKITCPNGCGIQLSPVTENDRFYEHRYCNRCGQRLDWSEEE